MQNQPSDQSNTSPQKVVVVIDDDASMLKSVTRLLAIYGFATRTYVSAEAYLGSNEDAATSAFCLLLDIHLGGISGIELRRRLSSGGSTLPIIYMTAVDDDATRDEAKETGCVAILRKPFPASQLLRAIDDAAA